MEPNFKLPKHQRLRSKKTISAIVKSGDAVKKYPIILSYTTEASDNPHVQLLFSVSKKKQKLAVNRNRIKRLLKEAFRLNKLSLCEFSIQNKLSISIMCIQVTGEALPFNTIEKKMKLSIDKLIDRELEKLEQ